MWDVRTVERAHWVDGLPVARMTVTASWRGAGGDPSVSKWRRRGRRAGGERGREQAGTSSDRAHLSRRMAQDADARERKREHTGAKQSKSSGGRAPVGGGIGAEDVNLAERGLGEESVVSLFAVMSVA